MLFNALMKFPYALLLSLIVSACAGTADSPRPPASSPPVPGKTLGLKLEFKRMRLKNGMRFLVAEDHSVPVVAYQTWFKVGSVDEAFGETGLAHLFEHMMFKGTKRYGPKAFFHQLQTRGAQVNAYTTRDYTVYHETFTPNLLPIPNFSTHLLPDASRPTPCTSLCSRRQSSQTTTTTATVINHSHDTSNTPHRACLFVAKI